MGNRFGLKSYEVNALIDLLAHYWTPEDRQRLKRDLPEVYRKVCEAQASEPSAYPKDGG
jgi:hypothetical protein